MTVSRKKKKKKRKVTKRLILSAEAGKCKAERKEHMFFSHYAHHDSFRIVLANLNVRNVARYLHRR